MKSALWQRLCDLSNQSAIVGRCRGCWLSILAVDGFVSCGLSAFLLGKILVRLVTLGKKGTYGVFFFHTYDRRRSHVIKIQGLVH